MAPCSGRSRPISDFKNTDLPVPDGPIRTLTSPGGRVRVTFCQIRCEPNDLVMASVLTSTPTSTSTPSQIESPIQQRRTAVGAVTVSHTTDRLRQTGP